FIAIGGAIQAILTPELLLGFPQYRFIQFFLDHTLLIMAPLIMISLYNYTITFKSLIKSFLTLNLITLLVYIINNMINAYYMFLMHNDCITFIIDYLFLYSFYILFLEAVAFMMFMILYLSFSMKKGT